ncbi:MAG TPA: two-component system response regulator CreB [Steroidobacteraceae bacterium]|nr:two-component system response regulator CreB [Steroidobacteraceae bacterium]
MSLAKPVILIVEDEPGIADTLQFALRKEGFDTQWCETAESALQSLRAQQPALIVLDVGLPDMNGFDLFRKLRPITEAAVIFLTARSDEIDRVVGLELGADDYMSKPFLPRELVARVRSVLRRATPRVATGPAAKPAVFEVDEGRRQIRYYGQLLELSRYEFGLLKTLVGSPGHVFSRDTLLDLVWNDHGASLDRTVDAHVKTLRAKLRQVTADLDPIRTSRGAGYALAEDLPPQRP